MKDVKQEIIGSNNVLQVAGDYITTQKHVNTINVIHDPNVHITDSQAKEIKDRVQKIAQSRLGESRFAKPPYGLTYKSFTDKFSITSYKLLPKDQYEDAIKWLDKQIAIYRPKLKNVDKEQYLKDMYKAIHAKARQLGVDVYDFAYDALELKKPIASLKELSDARIKKLYSKLFNKR